MPSLLKGRLGIPKENEDLMNIQQIVSQMQGMFPDLQPMIDQYTKDIGAQQESLNKAFAEYQNPQRSKLGKIADIASPIAAAIGFLSDATSGNEDVRANAQNRLSEVMSSIKSSKEARKNKLREKFGDKIMQEEMLGKLRASAFEAAMGGAQNKAANIRTSIGVGGDIQAAKARQQAEIQNRKADFDNKLKLIKQEHNLKLEEQKHEVDLQKGLTETQIDPAQATIELRKEGMAAGEKIGLELMKERLLPSDDPVAFQNFVSQYTEYYIKTLLGIDESNGVPFAPGGQVMQLP